MHRISVTEGDGLVYENDGVHFGYHVGQHAITKRNWFLSKLEAFGGWQRDMMHMCSDKTSNRSSHTEAKFWSAEFDEESLKHMNETIAPDQFIVAAEFPREPTGDEITVFSPAFIDKPEGEDMGFTIRPETSARGCNA